MLLIIATYYIHTAFVEKLFSKLFSRGSSRPTAAMVTLKGSTLSSRERLKETSFKESS